jgi:hypothetical protein
LATTVKVHSEGIKESLNGMGLDDTQISAIQEGYENYRLIIDNTMQEVLNTFTEGKAMTAEVANATIEANNSVTGEVIAGIQAQRDAKKAELDEQLNNLGPAWKAEYDKRVMDNGIHYASMIQTTQTANDNINSIIAAAANENRELTAAEVADMIGSYAILASNSGQSLSNVAGAQDFLAANMKGMVDSVGLNALTQAGMISESASSQIGSLGSVQEKVGALQWAIDYYNLTGIPAKTINVDASPALQRIAEVQQALRNIPDEQVYINVAENRVYTATSPTGAQGVGYATGTDSHIGGPAILGDGGREEPFMTPGGVFGVSPSTDTLYPNLPKGTKVWPSISRFKIDIPHFATGSQGSTEAQRLIAGFRNRESAASSNYNSVSTSTGATNNEINIDYDKLGNAVAGAVINALAASDIKVEMDKRQLGRLVGELI